jgi:glyoxylase-like metal-dependent hydrolase (beta-lactamase superfamily II)
MKSSNVVAIAIVFALSACTANKARHPPSPAVAAPPVVAEITTVGSVLADGVVLIPGGFEPGRQPDGNTVIFRGPRGLVVMDTGRHASHSQKILDYAAQTHQPIVAVVNSHWHLDHVSGNPRLRAAYPGLTVYASSAIEGAMSGFLANSRQQALQILSKPGDATMQAEVRGDLATIDSGKLLFPNVVIRASADRSLAGRPLLIGYQSASVTAGDVWVFDRQTRVLAAGDLVTLPAPFSTRPVPCTGSRHWRNWTRSTSRSWCRVTARRCRVRTSSSIGARSTACSLARHRTRARTGVSTIGKVERRCSPTSRTGNWPARCSIIISILSFAAIRKKPQRFAQLPSKTAPRQAMNREKPAIENSVNVAIAARV